MSAAQVEARRRAYRERENQERLPENKQWCDALLVNGYDEGYERRKIIREMNAVAQVTRPAWSRL